MVIMKEDGLWQYIQCTHVMCGQMRLDCGCVYEKLWKVLINDLLFL